MQHSECDLVWYKSTYCNNQTCLEIAFTELSVLIRNNKEINSPAISVSHTAWKDFVAAVKGGELDP